MWRAGGQTWVLMPAASTLPNGQLPSLSVVSLPKAFYFCWPDTVQEIILIILYLLKFGFWPRLCSVLKGQSVAPEKNMCSISVGWNTLKICLFHLICCSPSHISLLFYHFSDLMRWEWHVGVALAFISSSNWFYVHYIATCLFYEIGNPNIRSVCLFIIVIYSWGIVHLANMW